MIRILQRINRTLENAARQRRATGLRAQRENVTQSTKELIQRRNLRIKNLQRPSQLPVTVNNSLLSAANLRAFPRGTEPNPNCRN